MTSQNTAVLAAADGAEGREPARAWHALDGDQVVAVLGSQRASGLTAAEAAQRLERHGANALPEPPPSSLLAVFGRQFKSPLIYLLLFAAGLALALDEHTDAIVILVVVVLNALIGAFQEGRAERAVHALRQLTQHKARVVRDGRELVIEAREVVPGDVLVFESGDAIAADARLLDAAALRVAEAALTGESVPVVKEPVAIAAGAALADRNDMAYAGTYVTAGRGRAVVVATGRDTEIGHIAAMAGTAVEPKTPLERRIDQFGRYVIVGALCVFAAVVGVGVLQGAPFGSMLMIGVSSLVGMVPEGLPVAMTIALAVGVQRMARRRAIVRRLSAVETLGSTTVICSDKTGTLTRNEMTVTLLSLPDSSQIAVTGVGYAPEGQLLAGGQPVAVAEGSAVLRLLEAGALCNDAQLEQTAEREPRWLPIGDPTEVALLVAALKAGIDPARLRERQPRRAEIPFDSAAKMMATEHDGGGSSFVVFKGAPEALLELCQLDEPGRRRARAAADAMAQRALRTLAVGRAHDARLEPEGGFATWQGRVELLGLIGQIDPPRTEVAAAVAACKAAGVRAVVVTGDHKATGFAIARELGIAGAEDLAVDGAELDELSDAQLAAKIERISVFARVRPAQKLRIVEAYQKRREVVAMTGDGVNDAPALVRADVGVAMGITGTEVAKDSAKIVIADDNFATIVAAVEEGRVVYRNIKKAVLLLVATSVAEVAVLFLAMLLGYPPPFAAVMILWNNLVTEGVITINLIMEPPEGDEMERPPIATDEPLLTRVLMTRMAVMIPAIIISTLGWFIYRTAAGVPTAVVQTETFTLLAICEWFNVLNCRSETKSALSLGLLRNPWLLGGLLVGNVLQIAVVFWEPLGSVFRTVPIGAAQVFELAAVGSLVLWAEELRKLLVRRRLQRSQ
jgi:Ca2+-transporting ATPase